MKNIILGPAIVIGCAVIGVVGGALYFAAVLGAIEWLAGAASAADDLGRRASFPAFAFGVPAGAIIGVNLACTLLAKEESYASLGGIILAVLVALPCIGLPLYASAVAAFEVLVLMGGHKTSMAFGYASIVGVVALAVGSSKLVTVCPTHRVSSPR